jgi:hypothetical protein
LPCESLTDLTPATVAELFRGNQLKPVYHGETGVQMLRELSRSYLTIVKHLSRVMNRLKAAYRSWEIPCAGRHVYCRKISAVSGRHTASAIWPPRNKKSPAPTSA